MRAKSSYPAQIPLFEIRWKKCETNFYFIDSRSLQCIDCTASNAIYNLVTTTTLVTTNTAVWLSSWNWHRWRIIGVCLKKIFVNNIVGVQTRLIDSSILPSKISSVEQTLSFGKRCECVVRDKSSVKMSVIWSFVDTCRISNILGASWFWISDSSWSFWVLVKIECEYILRRIFHVILERFQSWILSNISGYLIQRADFPFYFIAPLHES